MEQIYARELGGQKSRNNVFETTNYKKIIGFKFVFFKSKSNMFFWAINLLDTCILFIGTSSSIVLGAASGGHLVLMLVAIISKNTFLLFLWFHSVKFPQRAAAYIKNFFSEYPCCHYAGILFQCNQINYSYYFHWYRQDQICSTSSGRLV